MRNLVKYVGIGLLVMGLAACDNSDSKAPTVGAAAESNASGRGNQPAGWQAELHPACGHGRPERQTGYPGRTICTSTLTLPARKRSSSSSATAPMKIWRCWRNALEDQQRSRDPQLQVVSNKPLEIKGHTLQQLDSIISAKGQTARSSVILGKVDDKLLTLQVTLPADNQQQAQTEAESIINTLTIQ